MIKLYKQKRWFGLSNQPNLKDTDNKDGKIEKDIIILIRQNGKVDIQYAPNKPYIEIKNSYDKDIKIHLPLQNKLEFNNDKGFFHEEKVRGWIIHENITTALPENPLISAEMVAIGIEKVLLDRKEMDAKAWDSMSGFILNIGIALFVVMMGYGLYSLIAPSSTPAVTHVVNNTAKNVINQTLANMSNVAILG